MVALIRYASYASRFFCSCFSSGSKSIWDPTVSLTLRHPTLVLLERCQTNEHFKQILAQMLRLHLTTQTFPMSRLLYFSAISHPELLNDAIVLFDHFTPNPNLYIYTTMISALSFSMCQALLLYRSMIHSCIYPDEHTLLSLLKSSRVRVLVLKQIHVHVIVFGFSLHGYLRNSLIKMYLDCGEVGMAEKLVQCVVKKDVVLFNILISWHARSGSSLEALKLYDKMMAAGVEPDQYTIVGLLTCAGQLKDPVLGKAVHGWMEKRMTRPSWGLILSNALLDMYAKCEDMRNARRVFDRVEAKDSVAWNVMIMGFANIGDFDLACKFFSEMPSRDLVSWNSLLAGCARKGDSKRVMDLFHCMVSQNVKPDTVTAVTLIGAAADMGVLNEGRCVHGWVTKLYGVSDSFFGSALIDMYCKCGSIERAHVVFEMVSERDVAIWTAMITGLALHGHGTKALELFRRMQKESLLPNSVTLLAVLAACSHSGMVDNGVEIFQSMKPAYSIEPGVEHYGCLIDVLARSGRLTEAMSVIGSMPMKPSSSIWGSILSASKVCGNMRLAEIALKELIQLEPEEEGGYVLLSNVYAASGRWSYSGKIREAMENKGVKKMAGWSSVVVDGRVQYFISSDKRHSRWSDFDHMLCKLHKAMSSGDEKLLMLHGSAVD